MNIYESKEGKRSSVLDMSSYSGRGHLGGKNKELIIVTRISEGSLHEIIIKLTGCK